MEVKDIKIKGIPHEEFNDNEYLEKYVEEMRANKEEARKNAAASDKGEKRPAPMLKSPLRPSN